MLAKRRAVDPQARAEAAQQAAQLLISHPLFKASHHIACYLACENEFDCGAIIRAIWQAKKNCYLPIISAPPEKILTFVPYGQNDPLILNRYHILEPHHTAKPFPAEKLDLVIVPLVAFDLTGHRLGMGGGFYDKTFSFLRDKKNTKPALIGLAYAWQLVDPIISEVWDVALDQVVTENLIY